MDIIDTHIHLDFSDFRDDLDIVIKDSRICGLKCFIIPGASLHTLESAFNISQSYDDVYFALGIHPCNIDEISNTDSIKKSILDNFKPYLESKKLKAIGECGLDFFRINAENFEIKKQIDCFKAQIEIALEYDLPLILHVRDSRENDNASMQVSKILREYYSYKNLRGVFHCFNANEKLLEFSDRFYYGIGGILTFKNAQNLVEILPKIPINRILLETDAPYLAPIPHRGKRNESKFLPNVVSKISEILDISQDKICSITTKNAKELFNV